MSNWNYRHERYLTSVEGQISSSERDFKEKARELESHGWTCRKTGDPGGSYYECLRGSKITRIFGHRYGD